MEHVLAERYNKEARRAVGCDAVTCSELSDRWYEAISGMKNILKFYFSYFVVIKGREKRYNLKEVC